MSQKDPLGIATEWTYTAAGKVGQVTDALERKTVFGYDELHRLISQELPGGVTAAFAYDWRSSLVAREDGRGNTTYFEYDGADRLQGARQG